ncbi:MAG: FAD-binding oxidoreductase [Chloroflexi bacterium]|nr:FAD-binding oxidoreductase [Chloroflexota bacterium]
MGSTADVVVVGGGVIGTACAYSLARAGLSVHLVEREYFSSGTSRASHGGLALMHNTPLELRLGVASLRLWEQLSQELPFDLEYEVPGQLTVALNDGELPAVHHLVAAMQAEGIPCHYLDREALREAEPCVTAEAVGAALSPLEAMVLSMRVAPVMAESARRSGAMLETGSTVLRIDRTPAGRISGVATSRGFIATPVVVNAAGLSTPEIGAMVGVRIPVIPRKGHVLITESLPYRLYRHKIQEAGLHGTHESSFGEGVVDHRQFGCAIASEQKPAGNVLIGTSREFVGFDSATRIDVAAILAQRAKRLVPHLAGVRVLRAYTGLRPHTPDHLPIIGPVEGVEGFYVATGHEGLGTTLAPITGELIRQCVLGQEPSFALEPLLLARFASFDLPDLFLELLPEVGE